MTKIVVLGGNFGGMTSAFELKRKLKDKAQVVVISREKKFVYIPSLIWVPFGRRKVEDIQFSAEETFRKGNIEFIHDEATKVVGEESKIICKSGQEVTYDYLIVATGASLAWTPSPVSARRRTVTRFSLRRTRRGPTRPGRNSSRLPARR